MAELKEDYRKEERINGIVYDMSCLLYTSDAADE